MARKVQVLASHVRRIQARHENVAKFIKSEGKSPQEKTVMGLSQVK
jgi:hypothetical protein